MPRPLALQSPIDRAADMVNWSDADLDRMSEATQADIRSARALWRSLLPGRLRDLLDATNAGVGE